MMLTAGMELAEGKSNLGGGAVAGPPDAIGAPVPAPVVVSGGGGSAASGGGVDAIAAPEPWDGHASACTPSDDSKARAFMLATTRAGSRSSLSSAQSLPLQPRVISTWATRP